EDHLGEGARGCRLVDPIQQLPDPEPVRADAVDRRDGAVEDVIDAPELGGPLEGEDVERLLDDAQPRLVAAGIPADRAQRRVADVETALTEHDLLTDGDEGRGEGARLRVRGSEDVEGEPLGRL